MIGDAGVPVDVRSFELGTTLARLNAGSYDLALEIATEIVDPEIWRWRIDSRMGPPLGVNRGRVRDPAIDALFDRGLATREQGARAAVYAELEARVRDRVWVAPLWHEDHVAVVGKRAMGFVPDVDGRWSALARVG
jgi:ABC-type transport system substrate-binding protein